MTIDGFVVRVLMDGSIIGIGAHRDFGALTLLLQGDVGGLQVLNEGTGEWIDVSHPLYPPTESYSNLPLFPPTEWVL